MIFRKTCQNDSSASFGECKQSDIDFNRTEILLVADIEHAVVDCVRI